jgi:glutathione S-transferase
MVLHLYGSYMSAPTRAVVAFLELADIPYEFHSVNLTNYEHKSQHFLDMNPVGIVPFLKDGDDFGITESHAILKYLHTTRQIFDKWYPKDAKK